jgi:hypothetical protein
MELSSQAPISQQPQSDGNLRVTNAYVSIVSTAAAFFLWPSVTLAEHPVLNLLKKSPEVHAAVVAVEPVGDRVIVHLQDWHWVPYDYFQAEGGTPTEYIAFLRGVEAVQAEQYSLLKRLVAAGHKTIFRESLTPDVEPDFKKMCSRLWRRRRRMPEDDEQLFVSPNILSVGTPGRLLAEGLVDRVRAADDDDSLELTRPFDTDGNLRDISTESLEKRENHVVRQMLSVDGVSILVFGGAHNFADNVRRIGQGKIGLIVVATNRYRKAAQ